MKGKTIRLITSAATHSRPNPVAADVRRRIPQPSNAGNPPPHVGGYALKDQPFTLSITRTRASITDTLTLRERGNDLDRNAGQAFVRNLVP